MILFNIFHYRFPKNGNFNLILDTSFNTNWIYFPVIDTSVIRIPNPLTFNQIYKVFWMTQFLHFLDLQEVWQLFNILLNLQAQYKSNSQEIKKLKTREAQNLIQWNLMMADKEAEITALTDQIESLNRVLALDQKELDLLAESEGGLLELTRDISNTSKQAKVKYLMLRNKFFPNCNSC